MRIAAAALILAAGLGGVSAAQAQQTAPDAPVARGFADSAPPVAPAQTQPAAQTPPAPTQATAPARNSGDATADQIADWLKPDGPPAPADSDQQPTLHAEFPRQIHGEVGVSVSNRGYGGYAVADVPVGEASDVAVAVAGSHERLPWGGNANQRSLAIGIHLDGSDVAHWLSHDKCGVQHSVRLRDDPVVMADGTCAKPDKDQPPTDSGS